eukprot:CAMPEP_0197567966 /NCGR_PEP_ID=MMETSP1320-20131121/36527_1 /TAXON_ID=91990 /ORGANISM="Bolidomonas sp., Strain RCC2347" /LENGTH=155 /DNA_ID=CAMNT_0043130211 /DNA_START=119 /DNA_END=582 /DNA_ORIENTATION=-
MKGFGFLSRLTRSHSNDDGNSPQGSPTPVPSSHSSPQTLEPPSIARGKGNGRVQPPLPPPQPGLPPLTDAECLEISQLCTMFAQSVQKVVISARETKTSEWKPTLISLIVGEGSPVRTLASFGGRPRFTQKCVEGNMPPNLIHSLRLLRVIEMQP